jgi:MFS family permease
VLAVDRPDIRHRRRALLILVCAYTLSYLDRQVVTILAEPMKQELSLADWQIGVVSGLAFALFYTALGLPISRLADRTDRSRIIGLSVLVWSCCTMLCGRVEGFLSLAAARAGVGIGEAGCTPAAHSLISDLVPIERRGSALALYSLGIPIGGFIGLGMGGLIADALGWRMAFLLAGAPGIVMSVMIWLLLKDPRAWNRAGGGAHTPDASTFREVLVELGQKRSFWLMALGTAACTFVDYGQSAFISAFFLRADRTELDLVAFQYGMSAGGLVGLVQGLLQGVGGLFGTLTGGWLADYAHRRDVRLYGIIPAAACVIACPLFCLAFLVRSPILGLVCDGLGIAILSVWYASVFTTAQNLAAPRSRATASAVLFLIYSVVGLGLGPLAVGLGSDFLSAALDLGAIEGLRWSLVISSGGLLIAAEQ